MNDDKLIKLRCPGENFWAEDLGENKARVRNICLEEGIFLDDVVSYDPKTKEVVEVLERIWKYKAQISYSPLTKDAYIKVAEHLMGLGATLEGMLPGLAMLQTNTELPLEEALGDGVSWMTLGRTELWYGDKK